MKVKLLLQEVWLLSSQNDLYNFPEIEVPDLDEVPDIEIEDVEEPDEIAPPEFKPQNILSKYQPEFYANSEFVKALTEAIEYELELLKREMRKLREESMPEITDEWIDEWERSVGLEVSDDMDIRDRRERVVNRLVLPMTITKQRLKVIAESCANCNVNIKERYADNIIDIYLNGWIGQEKAFCTLIERIGRSIPAHLKAEYKTFAERIAKIYVGFSLQNYGLTAKVDGINPDDYTWLVDENGAYLLDENGYILLDQKGE